MSQGGIPLDQWVAEESRKLGSRERELLARFQREWLDGAKTNSLLFPVNQDQQAWAGHFDWFLTIENFELPESEKDFQPKKAAPPPRPKPAAPPKPSLDEEMPTVFIDPSPEPPPPASTLTADEDLTVVMDADIEGRPELDDLGTLLLEAEADTETPAIDVKETTPPKSEANEDKAPLSSRPKAAESKLKDLGTLDDLDSLILGPDSRSETTAPEPIQQPHQAERAVTFEELYAAAVENKEKQGTIIPHAPARKKAAPVKKTTAKTDRPAPLRRTVPFATGSSAPKALDKGPATTTGEARNKKASPTPADSKPAPKKSRKKTEDLDLDDLETMDWDD